MTESAGERSEPSETLFPLGRVDPLPPWWANGGRGGRHSVRIAHHIIQIMVSALSQDFFRRLEMERFLGRKVQLFQGDVPKKHDFAPRPHHSTIFALSAEGKSAPCAFLQAQGLGGFGNLCTR